MVPPGADRYDRGRFTVIAYPTEARLAESILSHAIAEDTFPGLPRPEAHVVIALAPNDRIFRELVGAGAPEWGVAIAFPRLQRIVMHGRDGGGSDPFGTLRHELAHLALNEYLGGGIPRWFDEGYAAYAAGEWGREEVLTTSIALIWRGIPSLSGLDSGFFRGAGSAQRSYALAYRGVAELASLGREHGLSLLLRYWKEQGSFDRGLRAAHGMSESDFEDYWKSKLRRQYGAIALVADISLVMGILLILLGPLWWRRRERYRRKLEQLRARDAAEEARERAEALKAISGGDLPPSDTLSLRESD